MADATIDTGVNTEEGTVDSQETTTEQQGKTEQGTAEEGKEAAQGTEKTPDSSKENKEEDFTPPVRKAKTPTDFYNERQARKQAHQPAPIQGQDDEDAGQEAKSPFTNIDETTFKAMLEKFLPVDQVKTVLENSTVKEIHSEVDEFLDTNPDFKPYAKKIKAFAVHPDRRNIQINSIAYEVAGPDLMRLGAEMLRKANAEANKTKGGGNQSRKSAGGSKVPTSDKEFQALLQKNMPGLTHLL